MLDNILSIVKDVALDAVSKNSDIPSDKKNLVVDTASSAITSGLTSNLGGLASLFSGGGSSSIADGIQKTMITALAEKVGISPAIAGTLASTIVPAVLSSLSSKVSSSEDNGFSLESIAGALGGGGKKGGGLLGAFTSLLGK